MKTKIYTYSGGAAVSIAVIVALIGVNGAEAGTTATVPTPIAVNSSIEKDTGTDALSRSFDKTDTPPVSIQFDELGVGGISSTTVRFVGASDAASFWVGLDKEDHVCLIATFEDAELGASSCSSLEAYGQYGLSLQSSAGELAAEGYLVPDRAVKALSTLSAIPGSVSSNFELVDPFESAQDRKINSARTSESIAGFDFVPMLTPIDLGR